VLDENDRKVEVMGQGQKKTFEGIKSACRGADSDDREETG
jgi:hypothetical protein